MLRVEDRTFADHMRRYVEGEIAQSEQITRALYRQRTGWRTRAKQFVAYVLLAIVDPRVSRGLNLD
jgi:cardiolipin synthase